MKYCKILFGLTSLCIFSLYIQLANADQSEIVKCIQPDGKIIYTNIGCDTEKSKAVWSKPVAIAAHPETKTNTFKNIPMPLWSFIFADYLIMSVLCFLVYGWDKRRAIQNERRIPESTLHLLELLGGWPGAFIAQRMVRHKNRKISYQVEFWLIVTLHVLVWADFCFDHVLWKLLKSVL